MSIHVVFLKKHDKYAAKSSHIVTRAVGKHLIGSGIAVPLTVYQKMIADEAVEKAEKADAATIAAADKKAAAEKIEAEKKAKADAEKKAKAEKLLKAKSEVTIKKATSRKAKRRGKQVKK
jgi:hypothetical protein